jgi:hypothetical protein
VGSTSAPQKSTRLLWLAALLGAAVILADVAMSVKATGDYVPGGPTAGDNAAPGLYALMHGALALLAPLGFLAAWLVAGRTVPDRTRLAGPLPRSFFSAARSSVNR